jgi:hypothetical protein
MFCLYHQIVLMMEAARTSETSVDIELRTRQYIPENSELESLLKCFTYCRKIFTTTIKADRLMLKNIDYI